MTSDQSPGADPAHRLPPSFTPQARSGSRPDSADDAISVGQSGATKRQPGRIGRPDDAVPMAPRVQRQSSREIPVIKDGRAGGPRSIAPRSGQPPQAIPPARGRAGARPRQGEPAGAPPSVPPAGSAPRQGAARPGSSTARSATPTGPTRRVTSRTAGAAAPVAAGTRPAAARTAAARPGVTRPGVAPARVGTGGIRVRKGRVAGLVAVLLLVAVIAWPVGLLIWANGKIQHVEALSGADGTEGTTYLLAGSDARGEGISEDGTTGARTDTIMLLHKPRSGPTALISLPRDTYVEIPDQGGTKLNATYARGGAPGLVQAVEGMTGFTVDHYVEVGFGGVEGIVDALGGVELCLDYDVNDYRSELVWTAGCHPADGHTALAFSRMRYSDPKGDIGRAERQRQVIAAISAKAADPSILYRLGDQVTLADAGLSALVVDTDTGIVDLGGLVLAFRAANGPEGITGTPPISNPDFRPGGNIGSAIQLDPNTVGQFWTDIRDGNLAPGQVGGLPQ